MNKQNLETNDKNDDAQETQQAPAVSKDETVHRWADIKMFQNVLLIWLDNSIDEKNNADCRNTIKQLRSVVNNINTFTNAEECIQFLEANNNVQICMIISGSLGQYILPHIHNMPQVDSIFIFCTNKDYHKQWAEKWPKIKDVFTEISPICDALKEAAQQCERNSISISVIDTSNDAIGKNLNQLNPTYMYTQILKEILLSIEFEEDHIKQFIVYCQDAFIDNKKELANVKELKRKYHDKTPIWWYTCECFMYPMLNRALRLMDTDIIIKMGFFISDLHRHIEKLHKEQLCDHHDSMTFTVYRGQGMSNGDFDQLKNTKGGLLSFNNFLSTSKDRNVSLCFAKRNQNNPDLVGILFVMTIDPSKSTTLFASINGISYFPTEDEVLFSMHTVFRIHDIKPMDESHRLFQVDLTLTSDNDKDLQILTDCIREETKGSQGWYRLGELLLKMSQSKKAQQVYEAILDQTTNEKEKGNIYNQLGRITDSQGKYKEAIKFYEKSLKIDKKILPPNHPDFAMSYNNFGAVYYKMGEYSKALALQEKALEIWQQSLPPNHPDLAMSYDNIGLVYSNMGEYLKAISSQEKALKIRQHSLPPNHPHLALSYNNIGTMYGIIGEYSKALSYHENALTIRQQSLPSDHPDLATSYNNIGLVYFDMAEYSKSLLFHEKALVIRQQALPSKHPDLAMSYSNIGVAYNKIGENLKALSSHEKALAIQQHSLPSNHFDIAKSYKNIGNVYSNMGDYSKALSYYDKALAIQQTSVSPTDSSLATLYYKIGAAYENMSQYSKVCSYYERAVDIGQRSLSLNHPRLQKWRKKLDLVKNKL